LKVVNTKLDGCVIIEPRVFGDDRGFFLETFNVARYTELVGITDAFVQDNHSRSNKGVLRGLHLQRKNPQGKLVRVLRGEVFDVAVDLRPNSRTFGQWESVLLSGHNKRQFWLPPGFAHGFQVLCDSTDFEYKCTTYYDPSDELAVRWDDPTLGIPWPITNPILSEKDAIAKSLVDVKL
jgi:dTDP-4-dehydrorhamnose 3,5-epimerase